VLGGLSALGLALGLIFGLGGSPARSAASSTIQDSSLNTSQYGIPALQLKGHALAQSQASTALTVTTPKPTAAPVPSPHVSTPAPDPVTTGPPAAPPVVTGSATQLTPAQVGALWVADGGSPGAESVAECIAWHESGDRTNAVSPTGDYGLYQIHGNPAALNPDVSTRIAISMSANGTNWGPWTTRFSCGV
jgi:hypothetical protein